MNDRLYAAAAPLEPAALTADKGAFFGSILGTLNHIGVADTIWLHRWPSLVSPEDYAAHVARTTRAVCQDKAVHQRH